MEQHPPQGGELQATPFTNEPTPPPEHQTNLTDDQLIHYHLTEALREDRPIDHATARCIAAQLHGGQASALYALASSGAVIEGLTAELDSWRRDDTPVEVEPWLDALDEYLNNREDHQPIDGWHQLWPAQPERHEDESTTADQERPPSETSACAIGQQAVGASIDQDEDSDRAELMHRIAAAGVTTLGHVATVVSVPEAPKNIADDQEDESDVFSWADAARWRPDGGTDELAGERLGELFEAAPDEQLGSMHSMGWFGLLKHHGRPGGIILAETGYAFRHRWETTSDDELTRYWQQLQHEHEAFTAATGAPNRESGDSHQPEIWVGSLSDYNNGRLHGVWLDAMLDPEELHAAIQFMLRNGFDVTAEEWGIFDYDDFCSLNLGEYESLEVVSRVANGIAEHGEAFAKWVEYVGERSEEALSRFEDHYLGSFDSTEAYVEHLLEESEAYSFEEYVPAWLKPYVKIDVELLARDTEIELYVAEGRDGGVFVFDTRF